VRLGITGHTNLAPGTAALIAAALRELLADVAPPLVGVTCLARGADQLFAAVVLELGGRVEVVLPAADYRERKVGPDNREAFESLISKAEVVSGLPLQTSDGAAYMQASETVLSTVERVVAVWDGRPAGGYGGTGDVVDAARRRGIPVTVVWPDGATRT
jgi:hypothetical protein